jgi:hypothetical protein
LNQTDRTGRTDPTDRAGRITRRLLWAVFVIAVPMPLLSPVRGEMPAARMVMLATISAVEMLFETYRGAVVQLTLLLLVQGLLACAALWAAAWAVSSLLRILPALPRRAAVLAIVVALLATASAVEIYRDPFRTATLHASLLNIYE